MTSLILKKRNQIIQKIELIYTKALELFKSENNNNRYWNRAKPYSQVITRALPIIQAFYLGFFLFFFINNIINYLVYIKNIL